MARLCGEAVPDAVVLDADLPGGAEALAGVCGRLPVAVVLAQSKPDPAAASRLAGCAGAACVIKPVREADLEGALAIALAQARAFGAAREEAAALRQALEDRKAVERAKGALMRRLRLDEPEAHRRLERAARRRGCKVVDVAWRVLAAEDVFGEVEDAGRPAVRRGGRGEGGRAGGRREDAAVTA